jgi:peptidoglycan hydrolase CwlO-like protein
METCNCRFENDINDLNKAVFKGNSHPSILSQISSISTQVNEIYKKVNDWDEKMGELLDFKAGELAVKKSKMEQIKNWGVYLGILVAILVAIFR